MRLRVRLGLRLGLRWGVGGCGCGGEEWKVRVRVGVRGWRGVSERRRRRGVRRGIILLLLLWRGGEEGGGRALMGAGLIGQP